MTGVEKIRKARDAGFSDAEIADGIMAEKNKAVQAGFSPADVDTYYGTPPFDAKPVKEFVAANLGVEPGMESWNTIFKTAVTELPRGEVGRLLPKKEPKMVKDFWEAADAGLQMSVSGLALRGEVPDKVLSEDAPRTSRIASMVGQIAGDLPAIVGGAFLGTRGGPVTAMAGAFALPMGLRKILMDSYEQGSISTFSEFWDRASGAAIETIKGLAVGAVTGAVGKGLGSVPLMMSHTAKTAITLAGEVATMTTVGNALEGHAPDANDFIDTALTLGAVKGSVRTVVNLRGVYRDTGIMPGEVAMDAQQDPTVHQDIFATNKTVPNAYLAQIPVAVEDIHTLAKAREIDVNSPAFMEFTEAFTGKQHLDDLTPTERVTMRHAVEEWIPDRATGGGAPPVALVGAQPAPPPPPVNMPIGEAQQAVLDRIVQTDPETKGMTWSGIYTATFDNLNPIRRALKQGGQAGLEASENPYTLERLTRGVMGKAREFIKYGAFDFDTYKTTTRGYEEILKPVKNDLDGFRAYMAAKRAIEKEGQGIKTGIPLDAAKTVVREGYNKYEDVHKERIAYREAMLDYLHKSGILSDRAVEDMRAANKEYVPFYRFFEDDTHGRSTSARTGGNPIKEMKGSERLILDPIMSDIKDTFLFVALAEKNAARAAFTKLGPGYAVKQKQPVQAITMTEPEIRKVFDEFIRYRKETEKKATETVTVTGADGTAKDASSKVAKMMEAKLNEALLARGYHQGEADQIVRRVVESKTGQAGTTTEKVIKEIESTTYIPEMDIRLPNAAATLFRAVRTPVAKDEIVVFEKGQRNVYKVDPDTASAFNDLDSGSANLAARLFLHTPASLLRAGVTLSPDFMGRNLMRDAVSSFIYAGSNPYKTARGAVSIALKDTAFHNWLKGGGANATMVAIDRDYIRSHIFELNAETGIAERAINVLKTPFDVLRVVSEFAENATRVGAVHAEMNRPQTKATIQALSLIAREATVDFGRHGSATQGASKAIAFFNPALQGIDRTARAFKEQPVKATVKALAAVTLPSLLLWYANKDDKEIQYLPRWQKDLFWVARVPLQDGGSFIARVPKPHEIGILFGTLPERMLDAFVADNPKAFQDIERSILGVLIPSMVPTVAVPVVEQFANRSTFTGGPLVPAATEKLLPEYQYNEYTSETAKALGKIFGAFPGMERAAVGNEDFIGGVARALTTPAYIENYVQQWTGGIGMYALQLADFGLRDAGIAPDPVMPARTLADIPVVKAFVARYPSSTAQSIQDFYDNYYVSKRYYDTILALSKEGDPRASEIMATHGDAMVQLDEIRETLTGLSKLVHDVNKNPQMTPSDKRQLIDTMYFNMIDLAKAGNTMHMAISDAFAAMPRRETHP